MNRRLLVIALIAVVSVPVFAGSEMVARHAAISTDSPYATAIGLDVLRHGGNAVDAAVAVSFALAVARPQDGNLGGGGVMLYYDHQTRAVWVLDFRCAEPSIHQKTGQEKDAPEPGLNVGVPGTVAGLAAAHGRFGRLGWKALIEPAAELARRGITVDTELSADLEQAQAERRIDRFPSTAAIFFPRGAAPKAGTILPQNDLANTLERLAEHNADFYRGATARRIVRSATAFGSGVTENDLEKLEPVWRAPIRLDFRKDQIYLPPPPFAGGLIFGESLAILNGYPDERYDPTTPEGVHLLAEAERRGYLDAGHYLADPTGRVPVEEILSAERAKQWRESILPDRASSSMILSATRFEGRHTTHLSIVDGEGNAVSLTTSLGENFGSGLVVEGGGFFLNRLASREGQGSEPQTASVPADRMMTPVIVLRDDKPFLVMGSRGGSMIPAIMLQIYLDLAVRNHSLVEAVDAPRFLQQAFPDLISYERKRTEIPFLGRLNEMGHAVGAQDSIGDVHAIMIGSRGLVAVADPREGGVAGGF